MIFRLMKNNEFIINLISLSATDTVQCTIVFCFQSRFFTLRTIYFTHGKYYRFRIIFLHEKDGFKIFNHTGSTMAKWVFKIDSDRHKNASKILFKGDFGLKSIEISRCKQLSDWSAIQSWIDFF